MHVHAAFGVGCGPITDSTTFGGLKPRPGTIAPRYKPGCGFGYGFGHMHLPGMDCIGNIDLNESGGHFLEIDWPSSVKANTLRSIINYITGDAAERADRLAVELAVANERADNLAAELAALRAAIGRRKLNRVPADMPAAPADVPAAPADAIVAPADVPAAPADAIVAPADVPAAIAKVKAEVPAGSPASVMVAGTKHAAE